MMIPIIEHGNIPDHQNNPNQIQKIKLPQVPAVDSIIDIDEDICTVSKITYVVKNGECVDVLLELE